MTSLGDSIFQFSLRITAYSIITSILMPRKLRFGYGFLTPNMLQLVYMDLAHYFINDYDPSRSMTDQHVWESAQRRGQEEARPKQGPSRSEPPKPRRRRFFGQLISLISVLVTVRLAISLISLLSLVIRAIVIVRITNMIMKIIMIITDSYNSHSSAAAASSSS